MRKVGEMESANSVVVASGEKVSEDGRELKWEESSVGEEVVGNDEDDEILRQYVVDVNEAVIFVKYGAC
jgi:hypothetical protein